MAQAMGATEIIMLGTLGGRLDHTLSNLYSGLDAIKQGIKITHISPAVRVDLVNRELAVKGQKGDLVSILALTDETQGVTIEGFEYPLQNVCLRKSDPYAVSNVMTGTNGTVFVREGILAVFHYGQS
jgi:thiamine pyrophosphokinase